MAPAKRREGIRQTNSKTTKTPPKRIKIGYLDVTIDSTSEGLLFSFNRHDEVVFGRYEERTATIFLSTDAHPDVVKETLVHEIVHAIIRQSALSFETEEEERIVRSISPLIYSTLKDNKNLLNYLT